VNVPDDTMSLLIGKPVSGGVYVDDSKSITITPQQSGIMTMITFIFGDQFSVVVNKIQVS
jgi:hypothetical protein